MPRLGRLCVAVPLGLLTLANRIVGTGIAKLHSVEDEGPNNRLTHTLS